MRTPRFMASLTPPVFHRPRALAQDVEYRFYCEFQSHEPEFDYLKSLEIEERINKIRWCKGRSGPLFLLSTNGAQILSLQTAHADTRAYGCVWHTHHHALPTDKTIKLWKIYEKKVRMVTSRSVKSSLNFVPGGVPNAFGLRTGMSRSRMVTFPRSRSCACPHCIPCSQWRQQR